MFLEDLDGVQGARAFRDLDDGERGAVSAVGDRGPKEDLGRHGQEQDQKDDARRAEEPVVAQPRRQPGHSAAPPALCASSQACRRMTAATWSITLRRRARLTSPEIRLLSACTLVS